MGNTPLLGLRGPDDPKDAAAEEGCIAVELRSASRQRPQQERKL